MGRLFQYNRFGNADHSSKKDNLTRNNSKSKESQAVAKCPAYSELYPEFVEAAATTTAVAAATVTTSSATATTMTTTTTSKSVELAIKKYQQWSSKFLTATVPTTAAATAAAVSQSSVSATATTSSYACSASSGYESGRLGAENDRELLVGGAGAGVMRRPKVYDCMKDFLRRKLFQQNTAAVATAKQQNVANERQSEEEEHEATSDYDEVDMLDSSYNAEDDDDDEAAAGSTDCSCSCTTSEDDDECALPRAAAHKSSSPQKSVLTLNCWQHSNYTDSTTEAEEEEEGDDEAEHYEDSDAGISDCCQLISDDASRSAAVKRKSPQKKTSSTRQRSKQCFSMRPAELAELLQYTWYQSRISTKAALERLQPALPGSFMVRRKAHHFELCLRCDSTTSKVKRFAVLNTAQDTYRLKGAKKQFTSLRALVTHHSVMAEQLPVTLALKREECGVKSGSLRYEDDFDTFESLQILGILKSLQAKGFDLP